MSQAPHSTTGHIFNYGIKVLFQLLDVFFVLYHRQLFRYEVTVIKEFTKQNKIRAINGERQVEVEEGCVAVASTSFQEERVNC